MIAHSDITSQYNKFAEPREKAHGYLLPYGKRRRDHSESKVISEVSRYLRQRGAYVLRTHSHEDGERWVDRPGIPDLVVCYRGRFIGIEVKSHSGVPTENQLGELRAITDAGGGGAVARTVAQARMLLDAVDRGIDGRG